MLDGKGVSTSKETPSRITISGSMQPLRGGQFCFDLTSPLIKSYSIRMKTDPNPSESLLHHGHEEIGDECHVSQTLQKSVGEGHRQQAGIQGPSCEEAAGDGAEHAQEHNVLVSDQGYEDDWGDGLGHCRRDAECQIHIVELTETKKVLPRSLLNY